jgi:lipid II:glycine glycyltransferase (peptidoglycan interpeptide bridge formation enzyme)
MIYRKPREDERETFDQLAQHPLQTWSWGNFRETTGVETVRLLGFDGAEAKRQMQLTFHPIPKLPFTVGYYPKGLWPDETELLTLLELGRRKKALFIKLEPDVSTPPYSADDLEGLADILLKNGCQTGKALFTPYSFILDLTPSEEALAAGMKSKTRYNVRLAEKHGVTVVEDSSPEGFEEYLHLLQLTTRRQQFYAHTEKYHRNMWKHMSQTGTVRLLKAVYQGKTLAAWILFVHGKKLYYPYGASSREHKDVMASSLLMWEVIRFGKRIGCESLDMWGALGPDADPKDPWMGFHRFKEGYGGEMARFVGTFDLIIDPNLYKIYRLVDRWRWRFLRLKSKLPFFG